jgi:hypothetical protein
MQAALEKTSTITSGMAKVKGSLSLGSLPGSLSITGGGPFDTKADGGPAVDLQLSVDIAGSPQEFGLVAVDGNGYLTVGDKALEQKGTSSFQPGQIPKFLKALGDNLTNVKSPAENSYSATVDLKKMIEGATGDDAEALKKLSIPGLGSGDSFTKSLSTADVTITVDAQGYAQTMDINMPITQGGNQGGIRATITLSEINQPQTIDKPKNVVSDASELGGIGAALAGGGQ